MSLLELAANPIFSGLTGGLFSVATGVLNFFQKRQDNAHALALRDKDRELLALQANVDQAKLAGLMALSREQGAASAFTASIEAEAKLTPTGRWTSMLRESVRPILVYTYQIAFFIMLGAALLAWFQQWAGEAELVPLIQYMVVSVINTATMTVSWYFGQRQIDRVSVSWGNKTAGAALRPAAPVAPSIPTKP